MPDCQLVTIAAAVTTSVAGASLPTAYTYERTHDPVYPQDATGVKVFIVSPSQTFDLEGGTRAEWEETYTVLIGVFGRVTRDSAGKIDRAQVDALLYFVEKVVDHFKQNRGAGNARLQTIDNPIAFDPDTLEQKGTFQSIITLTYRLYR